MAKTPAEDPPTPYAPTAYEAAATKQYGSRLRPTKAPCAVPCWSNSSGTPKLPARQWSPWKPSAPITRAIRPSTFVPRPSSYKLSPSPSPPLPPSKKPEARKIAEQALVKAKAAKTYDEFGTLAEQLSQDDWRVMMGDHGWVHRGTVTPDLGQAPSTA